MEQREETQRARSEAEVFLLKCVVELERRVVELEGRLSDRADWRPDAGDLAQKFLWEAFRDPDGRRQEPADPVTGFVTDDVASGQLRPTTWAQLLDCVQIVASDLLVLIREHADLGSLSAPPSDREDEARVAAMLAAAYGTTGRRSPPSPRQLRD